MERQTVKSMKYIPKQTHTEILQTKFEQRFCRIKFRDLFFPLKEDVHIWKEMPLRARIKRALHRFFHGLTLIIPSLLLSFMLKRKWLKCATEQTTTVPAKYVEVNYDTVWMALKEQQNMIMQRGWDHGHCSVVMGAKQFYQLKGEANADEMPYMAFEMQRELQRCYSGRDPLLPDFGDPRDCAFVRRENRIMGLKVYVTPWMDGVVVLPEEP